jgi:hypothetical protein
MAIAVAERQAECTPEQGDLWSERYQDGYQAGRGDARFGRDPRMEVVTVPAEVPFENGAQYVARHVEQAWAIGYASAWRYETSR